MKKFTMGLLFTVALFMGCTDQQAAKQFGGSMQIDLPNCQKLVNATWKEANLWYLTRIMKTGETPDKYMFSENSSWGVMQGTVYFVEHCDETK